jgi:hypothetical protein
MFESILTAAAVWREILHISEWTGLSIGVIVALAALVYLDPRLFKPALIAAGIVTIAYASVMYGDHVGRADVEAQWAAARAAAIKAEEARDRVVAQQLEQKYAPQLAMLDKQAKDNKDQANAYERKIMALMARSPAGSACQLGDAAERVRHR